MTIARTLAQCDTCASIKPDHHAPLGHLKPLQVPVIHWNSVLMEFTIRLLDSNNYNALLIVVDKLTKMSDNISTYKAVNYE